jgi:hypothetical protein
MLAAMRTALFVTGAQRLTVLAATDRLAPPRLPSSAVKSVR